MGGRGPNRAASNASDECGDDEASTGLMPFLMVRHAVMMSEMAKGGRCNLCFIAPVVGDVAGGNPLVS